MADGVKVRYTGQDSIITVLGYGPDTPWKPGQVRRVSDEDARHLLEFPYFETATGDSAPTESTPATAKGVSDG